jgi:hypothetical protein
MKTSHWGSIVDRAPARPRGSRLAWQSQSDASRRDRPHRSRRHYLGDRRARGATMGKFGDSAEGVRVDRDSVLGAFAEYRAARIKLLAELECASSNRDPMGGSARGSQRIYSAAPWQPVGSSLVSTSSCPRGSGFR